MATGSTGGSGADGGDSKGVGIGAYLGEVASKYITNYVDYYMSAMESSVEMFRHSLEFQNERFSAYITKTTVLLENTLSVMVSGVSKTANDIASMAMKNRMSEAKANVQARTKELLAERQFNIEKARIYSNLAKKVGTTSNDFAKAALGLYSNLGNALSSDSNLGGSALETGLKVAGNLSSAALAVADVMKDGIDSYQTILEKTMDVDIKRMEYEKELVKQASEQFQSVLEQGEKAVNSFMTLADEVRHTAEQSDKLSHMQAVQMGYYGSQGDDYAKHMMLASEKVSEKFEKKTEDLINIQKSYMDESTRNVQMSVKDYENIISTGRSFGMSDTEASSMFGSMNVFNTSIESGADMLTGMYKTVTKMGLSTKKFSSDLVNNLKLAQKYNFKGGVENVMKMTQWAEQTRIQMSSATNFAEKFLSGSISDALEASARLQVLGGSAAMYSDPIAMLYEAGADMGSFMRRQAAMFNDISGTFDETIGETTFSWYENMMIKQRAMAAGLSEEEAKNSIRQRHKQERIDNVLRGSGLTEEEMTAVGNRATYNAKKKRWEIVDIHNKTHDINELRTNKALLKNLMPEDKNDALIDIAQRSLGFSEQQTRYQAYLANHFGAQNYDDIVKVSNKVMAQTEDFYTNMDGFMSENMVKTWVASGEAQAREYKTIMDNPEAYGNIIQGYLDVVNKISTLNPDTLNGLANTFNELSKLDNIDQMIAYFYEKIKAEMPDQEQYTPHELMKKSLAVYNDYAIKINEEVFEDLVATGRALCNTFEQIGLNVTKYFGVPLFSNLGIDAMEASSEDLLKYGKIVMDGAMEVVDKVLDKLMDKISNFFRQGWNWLRGGEFYPQPDDYGPGGSKSPWWFDIGNPPEHIFPKRRIYEDTGMYTSGVPYNPSGPSGSTIPPSLLAAASNMANTSIMPGNTFLTYNTNNNTNNYTTPSNKQTNPFAQYGIKSANVPGNVSLINKSNNNTKGNNAAVPSNSQPNYLAQTGNYGVSMVGLNSVNSALQGLSNIKGKNNAAQQVPFPVYAMNNNMENINNNVNRIMNMMGGNNGKSNNINLNNSIKVNNNATPDAIKNAIIAAIREDPNFTRTLNELISRGGESVYTLSGNNARQSV